MSAAAFPNSGNVLTALAARAREMSSRRLFAVAVIGAGAAATTSALWPSRWLLTMPGISLLAFGAWGLMDIFITRNILRFSGDQRAVLRTAQKMIAAVGVTAAFGIFFIFFGKVLGEFIS